MLFRLCGSRAKNYILEYDKKIKKMNTNKNFKGTNQSEKGN